MCQILAVRVSQVEEGIVVGGGCALLRLSQHIDDIKVGRVDISSARSETCWQAATKAEPQSWRPPLALLTCSGRQCQAQICHFHCIANPVLHSAKVHTGARQSSQIE